MTPIGNRTRDFPATSAFIKYACHAGLGFYAVTKVSGSNLNHITGYPDRYDCGSPCYMHLNAGENKLKQKSSGPVTFLTL
jgi:hypothetical protein